MAREHDYSSPSSNTSSNTDDGSTNREKGIMSQYSGPKGTTGNINDFSSAPGGADRSAVSQFSTYGRNVMNQNIKDVSKIGKENYFDKGLGKFIKNAALFAIPGMLPGKLGQLYSGYNQIKGIANTAQKVAEFAKNNGITDKNVISSLTDTMANNFGGFNTASKGPKDTFNNRDGGNGDGQNQQSALQAEYYMLLQQMEKGLLQAEDQERFNTLKSRLGLSDGGITNVNLSKGKLGEMLHG